MCILCVFWYSKCGSEMISNETRCLVDSHSPSQKYYLLGSGYFAVNGILPIEPILP